MKRWNFSEFVFFSTILLPRLGALPSTDFTGIAPATLRTDYELFLNPDFLGAFELARQLSFLFQLSVQSFSAFLTSSASQLTSIWLKRQNTDCYSGFLCTFPHFDLVTIAQKNLAENWTRGNSLYKWWTLGVLQRHQCYPFSFILVNWRKMLLLECRLPFSQGSAFKFSPAELSTEKQSTKFKENLRLSTVAQVSPSKNRSIGGNLRSNIWKKIVVNNFSHQKV